MSLTRSVFGSGSLPKVTTPIVDPAEVEARLRGDRGFGPMIDQLLRAKSLSLMDLGQRTGVRVEVLSTVLRGEKRATAELVRLLSVALDLPFPELFDVWDREAPGSADRMTVAEARDMIRRLLAVGVQCPCCGRTAKQFTRGWRPVMVSFLRWLVANYRGEPLSISPWCDRDKPPGGDYGKVKHWGLATKHPEGGKVWSPTARGIDFVRGNLKVPASCVVWRGEVLSWSEDLVDFDAICRGLAVSVSPTPNRETPPPALPGMRI